MSDSVLEGLHVLVLEDDAIISMSTQDILEEMGCQVSTVLNLKAAFAAIEQKLPGAAVLDVNIGENTSYEFAQQLRLRGVPFVFLSGYDLSSFGPQWAGHAFCQKPCQPAELRRALIRTISDAVQAAGD
jgi:CheY-like chemotaxis protein